MALIFCILSVWRAYAKAMGFGQGTICMANVLGNEHSQACAYIHLADFHEANATIARGTDLAAMQRLFSSLI